MPNKPEIVVCDGVEDLSVKAADAFVKTAATAVSEKDMFTVALSGGNTPLSLYRLLATDAYIKRVDWKKVHFFWGDERCVAPGHPDSNFTSAYVALLARLVIPEGNIHRIRGEMGDAAATLYEEELKTFFKLGQGMPPPAPAIPEFDLMLLGMGADGHTASIFPGTVAVAEDKRLVMAVYVQRLKAMRITLTPPVIKGAKNIVFLVAGDDKKDALLNCIKGEFKPYAFPAQITRFSKGAVTWFVDRLI